MWKSAYPYCPKCHTGKSEPRLRKDIELFRKRLAIFGAKLARGQCKNEPPYGERRGPCPEEYWVSPIRLYEEALASLNAHEAALRRAATEMKRKKIVPVYEHLLYNDGAERGVWRA
jgi:hypothetical protein